MPANWFSNWFGDAGSGGGTVVLDPTVATSGDLNPIERGSTYACTLTTSDLSTADEVWLTVKPAAFLDSRPDSLAEVQIRSAAGLTILARSPALNSSAGELEVDGTALTVRLSAAASSKLRPGAFVFDVQIDRSGVIETAHRGSVTVTADVTNATS